MNKTRYMLAYEDAYTKAYEEGFAEGRKVGKAELLETILKTLFGVLPPESLERLRQLSADQLKQIAVASQSAATLAELGL